MAVLLNSRHVNSLPQCGDAPVGSYRHGTPRSTPSTLPNKTSDRVQHGETVVPYLMMSGACGGMNGRLLRRPPRTLYGNSSGGLPVPTCVACGPVAQWLEQSTHNRLVAGSNPAGPTLFSYKPLLFRGLRIYGHNIGTTNVNQGLKNHVAADGLKGDASNTFSGKLPRRHGYCLYAYSDLPVHL